MEPNFTEGKWFCLSLLWEEARYIVDELYLSKDSALQYNAEQNELIKADVEYPNKFFADVHESGLFIRKKVVLSNERFSLDGTAAAYKDSGLIHVTYDLNTAKSLLQPGREALVFPMHHQEKKLQGPFLQMLYYVNGAPCLYQFDPMLNFYTEELQKQSHDFPLDMDHALNILALFLFSIQLPAVEDVDMAHETGGGDEAAPRASFCDVCM